MPYLIVAKDGMKGILFGNGSNYMAVENTRLDHVQSNDGMNYLIFTKDGKTGLKDSKYKIVAEPIFSDIVYQKNNGFLVTGSDGKKGFIFLNGMLLEPKFSDVNPVNGGMYVVVKDDAGKSGYISNNLVEFFKN